jgi:hypothetical protein
MWAQVRVWFATRRVRPNHDPFLPTQAIQICNVRLRSLARVKECFALSTLADTLAVPHRYVVARTLSVTN